MVEIFLALVLGVAALHPGDRFPGFAGKTLTGKSLELPPAGDPAVVVFCFSRAAGDDGRFWNQRLSKESSDAVTSYTVIMLESVPKLFRSVAVSGIRKSMPAPVQDRTIISYQEEELWKRRLSVSDTNRAYVVLLGPDGTIRWSSSRAFADAEYSRLREEIERMGRRK